MLQLKVKVGTEPVPDEGRLGGSVAVVALQYLRGLGGL